MSDEGEKTCPLCAEEMDFTDQQLKPCKCGYEICVWCWHHIMDMAEKDHTEGRCPACRTAYNKEKIVGTGPNSERLVSDINAEKRHKPHKGKSKTSEGRKQLGSVRVIQRNLVYVVGLPLTFADEELLHRRDHFGQYGKVMKVSISRTASGAIQQFPNSTCSVYITYAKEEEAVRCIQSVHGFVLDSRPLKACFGTTKYCHAWLRSMPCANPDCLYLHEVGSQEDSFTKDEIVSAYTRNRVQQITGTFNSIQRRSGNFLPPPADDYCNDVSAPLVKPVTKTATNTNQNSATSISPPNSSSGRSAALPAGASWGARSSTSQTLPTSSPFSVAPVKPKLDYSNGPVAVSAAVASPSQSPSVRPNIGKKTVHNEVATTIPQDKNGAKDREPTKEQSNTNKQTIAIHASSLPPTRSEISPVNKNPSGPLSSKLPSNSINIVNSSATSHEPALDKGSDDVRDGAGLENICSSILSMSVHENQQLQSSYTEQITGKPEPLTSVEAENTTVNTVPTPQNPLDLHEVEDDLLSFDNQRANDPEITINRMHDFSNMFHLSNHSHPQPSFLDPVSFANGDLNRQVVDRDSSFMVSGPNRGHSENMINRAGIDNGGYSNIFLSDDKGLPVRGYDDFSSEAVNIGESSIIADILSMDDPWDECLTSPTNLARLFPKSDTQGSYGAPGPRKTQYNDQSKFSFAREQERMSHFSDFRHPADYFEQVHKQQPAGHDFPSTNGFYHENSVSRNGFPVSNSTESDIYANNHLAMNKNAATRSQVLPPPGFSGPSRPPPPGFTSQGRIEQNFDVPPANHMFDASSLSRYQYSAASSNNTYTNGDIEFMDPAILAVGKGTLASGVHNPGIVDIMSSFTPQSSTYEDARFQSLLQRSLPPHQNQRFADMGDRFSNLGDAYGLPTRVVDHSLANNRSPFSQFTQSMNGMNSNGQWDNWNEMQGGNNMGMAELLRNERLGYNNLYGGYDDSKIRMSSSGNLYNGAYGI